MGAANALAAYRTYSAIVGSTALHVLVYMCLVARDDDTEPWYQRGPEVLSEFALGKKVPDPDGTDQDEKDRRAALRRVERAVTELLDAGAIRTVVVAAEGRRARYRLYPNKPHIDDRPTADTRRKVSGVTPDTNCRVSPPNARQFLVERPTLFGVTPDRNCRAKEYEEERGTPPTPPTPLRPPAVASVRTGEDEISPEKEFEAFVVQVQARKPSWTPRQIRTALNKAKGIDPDPRVVCAALYNLAGDAETQHPGRLATDPHGWWWTDARKQVARENLPQWCKKCWSPEPNLRFVGDEDSPTPCPECHPSITTRRAV